MFKTREKSHLCQNDETVGTWMLSISPAEIVQKLDRQLCKKSKESIHFGLRIFLFEPFFRKLLF